MLVANFINTVSLTFLPCLMKLALSPQSSQVNKKDTFKTKKLIFAVLVLFTCTFKRKISD